MPDYDAHIEHLRRSHPERPVPTEREYYEEYLRHRYGDGPTRLLSRPSLPISSPLPRCPACVAEPTHERLYLAQTDRIDTRQLPQDIQPAMS